MKIIVPMAGIGKRMRPHTLTVPKPLIPVAGKPIVQWLIEDIADICKDNIEEVAYVIGDFGPEAEASLLKVAENIGAKGSIYHQKEALGTAHAVLCAKAALKGPVIVAFADTLFSADFDFDSKHDGMVFVHKVANPKQFGVVKINEENIITDFIEKPETFVSDLAIIGIYYFKDGENLHAELQYLIDNNIMDKGEYQLTNALENMKNKGMQLVPGDVKEWLDCGNKDATVYSNQRVLEIKKQHMIKNRSVFGNSVQIIEPCYIGDNVMIENSQIGPHVSIGENSVIKNSNITNSIIQTNTELINMTFNNSMIGNHVKMDGNSKAYNIGDYSTQI